MPDSSTFRPIPGDGDEYFLDPDEEEDPNEEWDYSAAARIKRLVAAINSEVRHRTCVRSEVVAKSGNLCSEMMKLLEDACPEMRRHRAR